MNSRERILMTFNHQKPDRIPTDTSFRPEVTRALMEYLGVETPADLAKRLGADGWGGVGVGLSFNPAFDKMKPEKRPGDWSGSGSAYIWHDERTFEDRWGIIQKVGPYGKYTEWITGPLVDAEDPDEAEYFPTPEDITAAPDLADQVQAQKDEGKIVSGGLRQPFKMAWMLRGMENFLCDYMINREFVEKLYDKIYAVWEEQAVILTEAGIDMLETWGDLAMQDRMLMPPDLWREIDKPRMKKLHDRIRAINPDLFIFIHTDGSVMEIMDDLIEIGYNVINPIQPECVDPVEVKIKYGDQITMHGCVSLQRTLPFGTPEDVREEIVHLIKECGYNGGLVIKPSNAVGPDCPLENVVAVYDTCLEVAP